MATQQGARIQSPSAELTVLRALLSKNKVVAGTMLGLVDESYFYDEESLEVFSAIKEHLQREGESPTYNMLVKDADLSQAARDHLKTSQATVTNEAEAKKAARNLNVYRQRRMLYGAATKIGNAFQRSDLKSTVLHELVLDTQKTLVDLQLRKSTENAFLHAGKGSNTKESVTRLLYEDRSDDLIPTGIGPFDDGAGGFLRGALVTIGSTSGGGKSTLTMAMGMKMARMGYKVLMVPLEMTKDEMLMRMMANASKMNLTKIVTQRLSEEEKKLVYKRYMAWEKKVAEAGGVFHIYEPEEDSTIEEIMAATSTYNADVKIIDYATLLKGADGEDQWRALGKIARYCKIHAKNTGCVVILIVQIDESGKIRYSRAMNEHSSYSWIWVASAEAKQTGIMTIEQPKSRFSMSYPFRIKIVYEFMRIEDVDESEFNQPQEQSTGEVEHKRHKGKSALDGKEKQMTNLIADV